MGYKLTKKLLTPDKWVRPQTKLKSVKGIVIHWVANTNSTAIANRNFFENRKGTYGSAHYIVGLQGEVIQCLPDNEMGYHVGSNVYTASAKKRLGAYPNNSTIGIECTHIKDNGQMSNATYQATLELAVDLLKKHGLDENDLWLHKTVVGWKDCHRWFANNNSEWVKFKTKAGQMLRGTAKLNPEVDTNDIDMVKTDGSGLYTVQRGDTLWGIGQAFDLTVEELEKLNPKIEADKLAVGQKIKVKEVIKATASHQIGEVTSDVWLHSKADFENSTRVRVLKKGEKYKVYGEKNGMYNVGNSYVSKKYIKIVGSGTSKPEPKPKVGRVTGDVWLHSKPDFTTATRVKVLKEWEQYKILGESNGMYKVSQNGWVSKKYIKII